MTGRDGEGYMHICVYSKGDAENQAVLLEHQTVPNRVITCQDRMMDCRSECASHHGGGR